MEQFNNKAENFYREIRSIEIYDAKDYDFTQNMLGNFPNINNLLYSFEIIPEDFERKISRKTKDGNYYHDIEIGFPLLKMDKTNVDKYQNYFNKKGFCVVLVSNVDKTALGNSREPLKIEMLDNRKDDNSGKDEYYMSITGETIINPVVIML